MSDIFREVDEALQREKAEKLWKEYGSTILTAAVLLVIGTAAGVVWRNWNNARNEAETTKLVHALEGGDQSVTQLKSLIGESRDGPESIALMTAAQGLQDKKDMAGAAALYKQAAEDRGTPKDIRDLARILFVRVSPDATPDQKMAVLNPVLDHQSSPFIWQARIEAALIAAAKKDYKQANAYLAPFKDTQETLPPSLTERADALRQIYSLKEGAAQ